MIQAEVALWARPVAGSRPVLLSRAQTDWQGVFTLEDLPARKAAWIEVHDLYYLDFRGRDFPIPDGDEVELIPITLQFGGSLHGRLLDGERNGVAHADVLLRPRDLGRGVSGKLGRTDSRGALLLSGIEPGEYTIELLGDDSVLTSLGSLWMRADAPTVRVQIRLDESALTFTEDQDPQQFRVYRAEHILSIGMEPFSSLEEIQSYVDEMLASRWWRYRYPAVQAIQVREGPEGDPARGGLDSDSLIEETTPETWGSGHIELPRWAWRELIALHEIAHVVSPGSGHGQLYARQFHSLVFTMLGPEAALELARAYTAEGVAW